MKNIEKLKEEQQELKGRLQRLIDFQNSEEYFAIPEGEKSLLANQRMGMEIYLNALTNRIYTNPSGASSFTSSVLPLMMGMLSMPSSFGGANSVSGDTKDVVYEPLDKE